jgi:hypothetical protein
LEVEAGQDNFIYVRAMNRGTRAANNTTATVYWSPVSTLVTPNLWTLVGSVTIPTIPTGEVLTVSNPSPGRRPRSPVLGTTAWWRF